MPQTAEAAKAFNAQLRATAEVVGHSFDQDHAYGFLCECGCEETAMRTLAEYDREGGAWLDGHPR